MSMKQSKDSAGQEISGTWLYTTVVTILRKRVKIFKKDWVKYTDSRS